MVPAMVDIVLVAQEFIERTIEGQTPTSISVENHGMDHTDNTVSSASLGSLEVQHEVWVHVHM